MGKIGYQGNPDVLRFPRLQKSDEPTMIAIWNDEMHAQFPTHQQVRRSIGKRLFLIKGMIKQKSGHGHFQRWFRAQHFHFGLRSGQKYMDEALEHYRKPKANNYSLLPVTDEVHAATAKKQAEFDKTTFNLTLHLPANEVRRLRALRKTDERVKLEAAVITAIQPWLKGKRVASRPT